MAGTFMGNVRKCRKTIRSFFAGADPAGERGFFHERTREPGFSAAVTRILPGKTCTVCAGINEVP